MNVTLKRFFVIPYCASLLLDADAVLNTDITDAPFRNEVQRKIEHKIITESINHHIDLGYKLTRDLEAGSCPEQVCEGFNAADPTWTCGCERYGDEDVQVECNYMVPRCSADNSTCYLSSLSQLLDIDRNSMVTTFCTTFTSSENNDAETCIRVIPTSNGRYRYLERCSATYKPGSDTEAKACQSCSICGLNEHTNMSEITLDCCNIQEDLKQTCAPVAETGAAIPIWDTITPEEAGMCTADSGVSVITFTTTTALLISVFTVVFLG